ncbi:hypothetical protein ABZV65_23535 [Streptomyces bauhiniae]|uniref:hypothetical protein n=1 Tax=Streptomyces bauhiniae TaxID=2340725 RepID=UPI0033AEBA45
MRSIPDRARTAGKGRARAAACVLAVVTALTGVSAGSATGAPAPVGTGVVLDGPETVDAYPYERSDDSLQLSVRNQGTKETGPFTLTLDTTSLKGIADVTTCPEKADHILVCKRNYAIRPGMSEEFGLRLRRVKGAPVGASGEIRMTVESQGVRLASRTVKVVVPDAGLLPDRLDRTPDTENKKVKPGGSMKLTGGFTNYGAAPRNGTVAVLAYDGMLPDEEFGNCEYSSYGDAAHGGGTMQCDIKGLAEANGSYDLDFGSMTVAGTELAGGAWVSFGDGFEWGRRTHHRGTGRELKMTPRPASAPPGNPAEFSVGFGFDVDITADVQAVGATVEQKQPRDRVKVTVGARNNGPAGLDAWNGPEPGEEPAYEVSVYLPAGTEAVTAPDKCLESKDRKGAVYYDCLRAYDRDNPDFWIEAGESRSWDFDLRVVDRAALKPGRVHVTELKTDGNTRNNTAAIVVRVPGGHGSGTGGTGNGSGSGGAPGSGGTSAGGGGGGQGSGPAAGGSTATATGGTGHGPLASTGTGPTVTIAAVASALALLLGGALFLGLRRRSRS